MRPDLGLLSRSLAPPQPRHPAMRKVTPPVAHRADMHSENCGDLLGLPPLQRQQDRPRPVRLAAVLRFRQRTQCRLFRGISRQLRSSRHACLHSPHPRQTIHSIAHSQAVRLDQWNDFAGRVHVAATQMATSVNLPLIDETHIYGAALLARTISNFQSVLSLLAVRQIMEAQSVMRASLENMFYAALIAKDRAHFISEMMQAD